jgi:hypothetical protein
MNTNSTQRFQSADRLADAVVERVGRNIVLALPLGLGKANRIANALFAKASADASISLHIFTALTLEKPRARQELERRFIEPLSDRLFGNYPDLAYAVAIRSGKLPANIKVNEFFFLAGRWLGVPLAQQHYISANYTHALQYVLDIGVNVIGQLVTPERDGEVSFSSNPDLTAELLALRRAGKVKFVFAGEVSGELPFMGGEAKVPSSELDLVFEEPEAEYPLFAPPREPVEPADYAAGLHAARIVPDGGTLQIGIGSLGDAVAKALILRHKDNGNFQKLLANLKARPVPPTLDHKDMFSVGLYGCTEMFVEGLLDLYKAGVLKREVDGAVLHAAFFLGSGALYRALREMPEVERSKFQMSPVSFVNEVYGDEVKKRSARVKARFINDAMMATLLGDIVSDGLENGQVVSGVGGQYNFIAQGFALEGARSAIVLRSHRITKGRAQSNIRWNYGHTTIPRHLRDIVITEYGVADLRGKSDREVIAAMLSVADARFQDELLARAKAAGKIEKEFEIPTAWRDNTPAFLAGALGSARGSGVLPAFPFGTDFTDAEQTLLPALKILKESSPLQLVGLAMRGLLSDDEGECLERMGLSKPRGAREFVYAALLRGALAQNR